MKLFEQALYGKTELNNRIIMSAMVTNYANIDDIHARKKIPLNKQIELDNELLEVISEEVVDIAMVKQLPELTKLFLEYGMNVEAYPFDVMHAFTWLRHYSGIRALVYLLKNGMSADFADGFIWDMIGDRMQFESPEDDVLRIEYASKMTMLVAAYYKDKLDECKFIKYLIEPENNDVNILESFKNWGNYAHQIVSEDFLDWDYTKVRIFDCDTRKKVWEYSYKSLIE